ncbi:MAG TPA: hypothetical protein VL625_01305 [Patescibacteria group bacterium]|nr:hypothetical protein [Patescibacteria group bacterium]
MNVRKRNIVLGALAAVFVLATWFALFGFGLLMQEKMQNFLARHGIGEASFMSYGHGAGQQIVFSDVRLDPDGFSTIGAITARLRWLYVFSSQPFSEIVIDKLSLTGEIDADGNVTFAGLNPVALLPLAETDSLILDAGKIDLSTNVGEIRVDLKLRMTRQPDGSQKVEAAVFSNQHEFTVDSRWDAKIARDGKWSATDDLRDMRMNLPHLVVSRVSGWLSFDGSMRGISAAAGQIDAGQVRIGDKTIFSPARLTMEGPYDASHVILHGDVKAYNGMSLTAEIIHSEGKAMVAASVEAKKIDDMLSFLTDLREDMQKASPHSSALTTLLLTPGNLERIRTEAAKMTYDSVVLNIDGPMGNLSGVMAIKWNGRTTGRIALSPGEP